MRTGAFEAKKEKRKNLPAGLLPLAFLLPEMFAFRFLGDGGKPWPLAFGVLWAVMLSGGLYLLPWKGARAVFALLYGAGLIYAVGQSGYCILFDEMLWLSEFRYAPEGAGYLDILTSYPAEWFFWVLGLLAVGIALVWKFPHWQGRMLSRVLVAFLAILSAVGALVLPQAVFEADDTVRYSQSDYGRMQSAEAAYENMFNAHRLYQVCGLYQTMAKDLYANGIYPLTPGYRSRQEEAKEEIHAWFAGQEQQKANEMTGLLAGKNVIVVLMESMDDWMLGEFTPTINRLMEEGIHFTNLYTPPYGGIRTFNTEFCLNTGSFLSSAGGYAFDYVTNTYNQSLASLLTEQGYSAKVFHYNSPTFYSRGVFSESLGYEEYVCYEDFLTGMGEKERKNALYDDCLLFDNEALRDKFFRQGSPTLNFVITRAAHLSYKYNEVLSAWGLRKYPEFRNMTGHSEVDCALLKAKLVDDFFARMMQALEEQGQLENTVILAVTDHYSYGMKDTKKLMEVSGVSDKLLLERTPAFLWASGLEPMEVNSVMNTSDLLPTFLNLLGVESPYRYMGQDVFSEDFAGFVPFSDGSWITEAGYYNASAKETVTFGEEAMPQAYISSMAQKVHSFTHTNNQILETDYYE